MNFKKLCWSFVVFIDFLYILYHVCCAFHSHKFQCWKTKNSGIAVEQILPCVVARVHVCVPIGLAHACLSRSCNASKHWTRASTESLFQSLQHACQLKWLLAWRRESLKYLDLAKRLCLIVQAYGHCVTGILCWTSSFKHTFIITISLSLIVHTGT